MRTMLSIAVLLALSHAVEANAADQRCAGSVDLVQPADGVISSPKIAAAVALAYLNPIYGEANMRRELPLKAVLSDGVWKVTGTLFPLRLGGTAEILLCQHNGTVLKIIHYK